MKKLVVLGAGESGVGAAILAKKQGWSVFVSDKGKIEPRYIKSLEKWGIEFEAGRHTMERILEADEVVKSPGIPDSVPVVVALKEAEIPIISEIEFAGRYTTAKTICVTGSNGKTTVATLIHKILFDAGYNVGLGGNIGSSFAYQVALEERDWYVLELSSFQMDDMREFRADIGVLMNITPDHLDRYNNDMQRYIDSKMQITRNQRESDYFIYCADDINSANEVARRQFPMQILSFAMESQNGSCGWREGDKICLSVGGRLSIPISELKIEGQHNLYNAMAASLVAMVVGVKGGDIRRSLSSFMGVEHRLERLGELDGVEYINDSKATNVEATWFALQSISTPIVWIAGGTDKGNDYYSLRELVGGGKVRALICMGVDNDKLIESFKGLIPTIKSTHSLDQAMTTAYGTAKKGDTVLLSPACASFDLFKNYEDRGEQFKQWVESKRGTK